jgi:hypothetical protein
MQTNTAKDANSSVVISLGSVVSLKYGISDNLGSVRDAIFSFLGRFRRGGDYRLKSRNSVRIRELKREWHHVFVGEVLITPAKVVILSTTDAGRSDL